jgi:hypothetical protein
LLSMDLLLFRNHAYLAVLLGTLITLTAAGSSAPDGSNAARVLGLGPGLVRAQTWLVYLWAFVNKFNGPFLDGWVLEGELRRGLSGSLAELGSSLGWRPALCRIRSPARDQRGSSPGQPLPSRAPSWLALRGVVGSEQGSCAVCYRTQELRS